MDEFEDGIRILVPTPHGEIGVFRVGDRWFAFLNRCLHQGGPVCEGIVVGKVSVILDDQMRETGHEFSSEDLNIVCPWHGWEYDIGTGQFAGDPRLQLRSFPVRVNGDRVLVIT